MQPYNAFRNRVVSRDASCPTSLSHRRLSCCQEGMSKSVRVVRLFIAEEDCSAVSEFVGTRNPIPIPV
jgi:hypothetical protein